MNEEEQVTTVEEPIEPVEPVEESTYRIETPLGDAVPTVEVDSTTGEPIEGVTKADIDALTELMQKIESKTVTTTEDGSPLSLTYEQGTQIIDLLNNMNQWVITIIAVFFVAYIFRWIYKLFARDFFGGL